MYGLIPGFPGLQTRFVYGLSSRVPYVYWGVLREGGPVSKSCASTNYRMISRGLASLQIGVVDGRFPGWAGAISGGSSTQDPPNMPW